MKITTRRVTCPQCGMSYEADSTAALIQCGVCHHEFLPNGQSSGRATVASSPIDSPLLQEAQ